MELFHLTFASDGRLPLLPDEGGRRRAVRALARVAGAALLLFYIVDDHLHVVVECEAARLGRLSPRCTVP